MIIFEHNTFIIFAILTISNGMPYEPLAPENSTSWPDNSSAILAEKLTMLGLRNPKQTTKNVQTTPTNAPSVPDIATPSPSNKNLLNSSKRLSINLLGLKNVFHRKSNSTKDAKSIDKPDVEAVTQFSPEDFTNNLETHSNSLANMDNSEFYSDLNNEVISKSDAHKSVYGTKLDTNNSSNILDLTEHLETTIKSQLYKENIEFNELSDENTTHLMKDINNFAGSIYNMDVKSFSEHLSNQDTMMENIGDSDESNVEQEEENIEKVNLDEIGRNLKQELSLLGKLWSGLSNTIAVLSTQLTSRRQPFQNLNSTENERSNTVPIPPDAKCELCLSNIDGKPRLSCWPEKEIYGRNKY